MNKNGYTLLETLVAIMLLAIISVPVLSGIYRNNQSVNAEHKITADGLLEQEACRISCSMEAAQPSVKRIANAREWEIKCERQNSGIEMYHLVAMLDNKKKGEIYFLKSRK